MKVRFQKIVSLVLVISLSVSCVIVSASATAYDMLISYTVRGAVYYSYDVAQTNYAPLFYESGAFRDPSTNTNYQYDQEIVVPDDGGGYWCPVIPSIQFDVGDESYTYGSIGIYVSLRFVSTDDITLVRDYNLSNDENIYIQYYDGTGYPYQTPMDYSILDTWASDNSTSMLTLTGSVDIPAGYDYDTFSVSNLGIALNELPLFEYPYVQGGGREEPYTGYILLYIPSCRFVYAESSDVLDNLESIATNLVNTNGILQTMYGDVVSLLNDIYIKLGDIEAVEDLSRSYIGRIMTSVSSMELNVNNINIYTKSMNNLLTTYLPYLEELVSSSDDIEATLETELSSIDSKLDTFLLLYRGFLDVFDDMLEYESDNNQVLNNMYSAVNTCRQSLMLIWMNNQEIIDDLDSYNAILQQVLEYTMYDYTANLDIADKLDALISIMSEFTDGYIAGATDYEFPDGYVIEYADGTTSEKFSFFDLAKAVVSGIWHVVTGAVTTFIGGLTGLISGISNVSGFFDFYRDGEIYDAIDYGGGDIWD